MSTCQKETGVTLSIMTSLISVGLLMSCKEIDIAKTEGFRGLGSFASLSLQKEMDHTQEGGLGISVFCGLFPQAALRGVLHSLSFYPLQISAQRPQT